MKRSERTTLLVLMVLVMVVLNADGQVMAPMLSTIEAEFGVGDGEVGAMMALFTVVGALVSLAWGYFADKASRKLLFALSVAIGELPCALTAFAPDWTSFFVLRMLTGIGVGAAFPLVFSIVGDIFDDKERPMAAAVLSVAFSAGNILGPVVGGYLGPAVGWRLPFLAVALPNIPLLLAFWLLVPEPRAAASEAATRELVAAGVLYPRRIRLRDYGRLARVPTNVILFLQGLAGTIPWGSFFFLNKFLESDKGLSVAAATTVYLVFGLGMVAGNLAGGRLGAAVYARSPRALPAFCGATTLVGMGMTVAVVYLPGEPLLLAAAGFLAAGFAAMTGPNMRTILLDVNLPEDRGPIFSVFNLTDSLGTGFGRFVAGSLSAALGLAAALAVSAAFWLVCGILLLLAGGAFLADLGRQRAAMAAAAAEMRGRA